MQLMTGNGDYDIHDQQLLPAVRGALATGCDAGARRPRVARQGLPAGARRTCVLPGKRYHRGMRSKDPRDRLTDAGLTDDAAASRAPATCTGGSTGLPPEDDDAPPIALDGYAIGELLGRGGMGEVVLAHDEHIGREVAIKRMRWADPGVDAETRFLREAKIQARLQHPGIVPVHELGRDADGRPYFTMKRLAGTTLFQLLGGSLRPLLRAFVDVCLAIEFAHEHGVIHRDIKPTNIMLGDFGEVYVLDWGVARVLDEDGSGHPSVRDIVTMEGETQVGAVMGTPGYMAPEQASDAKRVKKPADVFAMGATLYAILAGDGPFSGATPMDVLVRT
ncbi:MAG: serine/threonine protein kinase, partial [Deltaproteobacteria bacterium]